jgi:hypothetical protein
LDEIRGSMRLEELVSGEGALIILEPQDGGISIQLHGNPLNASGHTARIMTELFIEHAEEGSEEMLATMEPEGNA